MRALVISGGGSKGAFAGGVAQHLMRDRGKEYDIFVGTSTGSLLVPLLASEEFERIKHAYTNTCQSDIFSICPFTIKKKNGAFKTSFNHLGIIMQFLRGRKTFGESKNLKTLINNTLTKEIYQRILDSGKYVIVTVSNLSRKSIEYKYARDCTYEEFCEWVWISANMVPFMSLAYKNGYEYADGGFGNVIPVQEAINLGAKHIDAIILNPRHRIKPDLPSSNAFNLLMKAFNFMLHQIGADDVTISMVASWKTDVQVNLIHTPRQLTENSFIFDPEQMKAWWEEGYAYAQTLPA